MKIKSVAPKPSSVTMLAAKERQKAPLRTPTDLKAAATVDIAAALNGVLADV